MPEEDAARPTRPFPDRRSGGGQTPDAATAAAETVAALFDAVPPALEGLYSFIVRERDLTAALAKFGNVTKLVKRPRHPMGKRTDAALAPIARLPGRVVLHADHVRLRVRMGTGRRDRFAFLESAVATKGWTTGLRTGCEASGFVVDVRRLLFFLRLVEEGADLRVTYKRDAAPDGQSLWVQERQGAGPWGPALTLPLVADGPYPDRIVDLGASCPPRPCGPVSPGHLRAALGHALLLARQGPERSGPAPVLELLDGLALGFGPVPGFAVHPGAGIPALGGVPRRGAALAIRVLRHMAADATVAFDLGSHAAVTDGNTVLGWEKEPGPSLERLAASLRGQPVEDRVVLDRAPLLNRLAAFSPVRYDRGGGPRAPWPEAVDQAGWSDTAHDGRRVQMLLSGHEQEAGLRLRICARSGPAHAYDNVALRCVRAPGAEDRRPGRRAVEAMVDLGKLIAVLRHFDRGAGDPRRGGPRDLVVLGFARGTGGEVQNLMIRDALDAEEDGPAPDEACLAVPRTYLGAKL